MPAENHYYGADALAPDAQPGLPRFAPLEQGDGNCKLLGQRATVALASFLPEKLEDLSLESLRVGAMGHLERYGLHKRSDDQRDVVHRHYESPQFGAVCRSSTRVERATAAPRRASRSPTRIASSNS